MSYNSDFYKAYEEYLKEPIVREAHNWIVDDIFLEMRDLCSSTILDLGCGQSHEFLRHIVPFQDWSYYGIDLNVETHSTKPRISFVKADYRTFDFKFLGSFGINPFISLFSSEITAPSQENYKLYERIFAEIPTIKYGLVSGFFYASKKDKPIVNETGDITSYQTLENIEDVISSTFKETRIILPVPSKLFGDDVYEIWKIFKRR